MEHSDMANVKIERTKLWPTNIYCFNTDVSILQHHDKMETDLKVDLKQNYTEIESGKEVGFNLYQGRDNLQNLESFKPFTTSFIEPSPPKTTFLSKLFLSILET